MPVGHLLVFFGKLSIQILCPYLNWIVVLLLSCMEFLHILNINSLPHILFASVFCHSAVCLFILLMVFFVVQRFFSLILTYLFIYLFLFYSFAYSLPVSPTSFIEGTVFSPLYILTSLVVDKTNCF